jgi:hypothetical protein
MWHVAGITDMWLAGPSPPSSKGRQEKTNKKNSQCTYVLYLARIGLLFTYDDVIFLIAFLSSPYRETPKNAIKKIGKGKKIRRTTPQYFFYHVFEFPSPGGA